MKSLKNLNKNKFNKIATHPVQSWEWGEFRKKWGNEVIRFSFGQITLHKIPFTSYKVAVFSKGPKPTLTMLRELKDYAVKNNVIFVKLEPNVVKNKRDIKLLKDFGAVHGKTLFTPSTFWIDLTKSEEELLKSFHPKTRYNIRLAQKKGVLVKEDSSQDAFEKYWELMEETTKRQGFYAHTKRYHQLMWQKLSQAGIAHLLTATYKKEIIAAWILFVWKDFLYYPYGASSEKHKNAMASNLMMWEAIRYGKKLGLKKFDLWGKEEGKGFTKFKKGYNPQVVEFIGTWDLPTSWLYIPYTIAEKARWFFLRLRARQL
ncbi:MAG: peptidoglycan bridge formation glycyltransferase FemA/FemB family protein [Patescibacteria group bacterium]|nr:peptidoglycan bridge formation glycyltransferase FemA/FemB family protein [Patescibacteria group bacterium]